VLFEFVGVSEQGWKTLRTFHLLVTCQHVCFSNSLQLVSGVKNFTYKIANTGD